MEVPRSTFCVLFAKIDKYICFSNTFNSVLSKVYFNPFERTKPFHLCFIVGNSFLKLTVKPMSCGVRFHIHNIKSLLPYFLYKVALISNEVVSRKTVTELAFCIAVVFVKPCCHVRAAVEMSTVNILELLYLAAGYATYIAVGHCIPKPDV